MSEVEELKQQAQKIREILVKADEKLLAGEISEDIYKQLTQGKLEMLKTLESKIPPTKSADEANKALQELIKSAEGMIKETPVCPACYSNHNVWYKEVKIKKHALTFGYYCGSKEQFKAQGELPLPKYIQDYLEETGYFESQKKEDIQT